jgi:type II secretory pathway predicted ATPase ExeA
VSNAFGETADPGAYVPRPSFEAALAALTALPRQEPPACAALIGEAGLGKTLALRLVAERLRSSFESLYVPFPRLEPEEFWAWVADALQMRRSEDDRATVLKRCRGLAARGTGFVLLIDDAAELPLLTRVEVIAACRTEGFAAVMAFASDDHAELSELPEHVRRIELGAPMTQDETRAYIAARLRHAGQSAEGAALLEPGRIAELHAQSEGVPGRLHALLEPWLARAAREASPPPREPVREPPPPPREPVREAPPPPPLEPVRPQPPPSAPPPAPPQRAPAPAEPPRARALESPPPPSAETTRPSAPPPPPARAPAATVPTAPTPPAEPPRRAPTPPPRGGGPVRRAPIAAAAVLLGIAGGLWFALSGGEPEAPPIAEAPAPLAAALEPAVPEPLAPAPPPVEPAPEPGEEAAGAPADLVEMEAPEAESEPAAPVEPEPPPIVVARPEPAPAPAPAPAVEPPVRAPEPRLEPAIEPAPAPAPPAPAPAPRAEPAPVRPPPEPPRTAAAPPPAPTPEPRVAPAPPPTGTRLNVNAIPWAEIEVDGRRVGQTPLGDLPLAPGTHRVTARLPDGRVLERSIEARGGEVYVVFP